MDLYRSYQEITYTSVNFTLMVGSQLYEHLLTPGFRSSIANSANFFNLFKISSNLKKINGTKFNQFHTKSWKSWKFYDFENNIYLRSPPVREHIQCHIKKKCVSSFFFLSFFMSFRPDPYPGVFGCALFKFKLHFSWFYRPDPYPEVFRCALFKFEVHFS